MPSGLGIWGPPTSTIDWCEPNYTVTPYVAEFFNSLTSLFIVVAGLLPVCLNWKLLHLMEWRFILAFLSVSVVGLGSVAFHGTLQFEHQMLDEVPMLWTVMVILYILVEKEKTASFGLQFPVVLTAYACLATYATAFQGGNEQWFSFHTFFSLPEISCLLLVARFFRGLDHSDRLRGFMRRGFYCWLAAVIVWLTDVNLCDQLLMLPAYGSWNLHAFGWHLLTSYALFNMLTGLWYHRLRYVLGVPATLLYDSPLPRVCQKKS
mmetsp:Transcript_7147/g.19596  ORF Transcript_7147/g.19596 Transcript_7147/m.19596 type:complete len:263 (-) Transcript_7147:53-841(-)